MTQAEFDEYLLLLRQMLRITSRRRREIATEIRDHLEERFEDLCGEGVSQKEAIQLAIEEFGDAATLAAHFITITRNREKRWMMKVTAMSIGAVLITLMAAAAFWPADRRGVAPQNAAAQQARNEPASEAAGEAASQRGKQSGRQSGNQSTRGRAAGLGGFGSSGFGGMGGGKGVAPEGSRTPAAEKRLASRIDVEFLDTPLPEVLEFIEAKVGIQFYVKRDRIAETAENADNPVTIRLKQVRADMALELALAQAGGNALTYLLRDGIAIITTKEDVEATTEVRIYNCRDLLDPKQRRRGLTIRPPMPPGGEGMEGGGMGEGGMAAGAPGEMGGGGMGGMGGGMGGMGGGMMGGGMMGGGMGGGMMGSGGGSSFGNARIRSADLIAIVQSMVGRPEDWRAEGGGAGMMAAYDGLVVVKTNTKNHAHIEKVLGMLREANSKQPGTTIRER